MKLEIKKGLQGKGVFTGQNISQGQTVFLFSDRIVKLRHKPSCDCHICRRSIQISELNWLYPHKDSYGWNLNHSCNPNCAVIEDCTIQAVRDISAGEEITIDYSTTTTDQDWHMDCLCNSFNCRKIIRSIQFLTKENFLKYKSTLQKFIAENYL